MRTKPIGRAAVSFLVCLWLLAGLPLCAQECNISRETDPYTHKTRLSTGFMELNGASVVADADAKEIDLLFSFKTDRCFDDDCTAMVYFEGSKLKLSLRNGGTMNCEGLFHFIFRNGPTVNYQLKKLATLPVAQIIFTDRNEKPIPVLLNAEQQAAFMTALRCLTDKAPQLLQ